MGYLSREELKELNFAALGERVYISRMASVYGSARICIGSDVRIDDFCVLSAGEGGIILASYIHIAVYSSLIGKETIEMEDFSGLSSRVSIYSSNEDYSGSWLTNPTVPSEFLGVRHAPVRIQKHAIVGSGSVVLPGVVIEEGAAIGALSLVRKRCRSFGVYAGNPAKRIGERSKVLLDREKELLRKHPL